MGYNNQMIGVFVEGEGLAEMKLVEVDEQALIENILEDAKVMGLIVEDGSLVFVNRDEQAVNRKQPVRESGIKMHSRIQVHRCQQIHVRVNYQSHHKQHPFRPFQTVGEVRDWAINLPEFAIDQAMRVNIILRLFGSTKEPELDVQLGSLAQYSDCATCFDLVVDPRFQGGK